MKRHGHLWEKICARENLELATDKAKRKKASNPSVQRVLKKRGEFLDKLEKILASGMHHTAAYSIKLVFEPKLRIIYALPFFPERIIHYAIMNILEPIWDNMMYEHSYSCRKGKGQHKASYVVRAAAKKYEWCAQLDISQFYVNIDHELLKKCYRRKIKDKILLDVLDEIVDSVNVRDTNINRYREFISNNIGSGQSEFALNKLLKARELNDGRPAGIAVGNLISQWFGNLFLTGFDFYVKETLKIPVYIRFCDDMLLFAHTKSELHDAVKLCQEFLSTLRLTLSKSKVFHTAQGIDFCGYKSFHSGYTLLRKSTAMRKKKEFKILRARIKNHTISRDSAVGMVAAAEGLLKHCNAHNLCKSLDFEGIKKLMEEEFDMELAS